MVAKCGARIRRRWFAAHDARAVAVADAGAVRKQGVAIRQVRVGVQRDRGDFELAG